MTSTRVAAGGSSTPKEGAGGGEVTQPAESKNKIQSINVSAARDGLAARVCYSTSLPDKLLLEDVTLSLLRGNCVF